MTDDLRMWRRDESDLNCIFVRWAGRFTNVGARRLLSALALAPLMSRGANLVHDLRQVDFRVPSAEIVALARRPDLETGWRGEHRIAAIANTDLAFGMIRMYFTLRNSPDAQRRAFRRVGDALAWLELPLTLDDPFVQAETFDPVVPVVPDVPSERHV